MDRTTGVFLNRIVEERDYVKCFYDLVSDVVISNFSVRCEKEIGCCDNGCCANGYAEAPRSGTVISSYGVKQEDLTSINGKSAAVWGVLLGILAVAVILLFVSLAIVACKHYRYANTSTTTKTVKPFEFPEHKIRPVEVAPVQLDVANKV